MTRLPWVMLFLLLLFVSTVSAQNSNTAANANRNTNKSTANANRKPIFRATADQIKQAQALLKTKSFYAGEETGKLDDATREGLKKYQKAEALKVTGALNKVTLEKMSIALTDKQKSM